MAAAVLAGCRRLLLLTVKTHRDVCLAVVGAEVQGGAWLSAHAGALAAAGQRQLAALVAGQAHAGGAAGQGALSLHTSQTGRQAGREAVGQPGSQSICQSVKQRACRKPVTPEAYTEGQVAAL